MAIGEFARALPHILTFEGGRVDDPRDPGGRTNKGITQATYDAYRANAGLADQDVYEISNTEVETIYRSMYWDPIRGDDLPDGLGLVVFDGAVNSGVGQSAKWLQQALGVEADGEIGPLTLASAKAHQNVPLLIEAVCANRKRMLMRLRTWVTFGRGWSARILSVQQIGIAWAKGLRAK